VRGCARLNLRLAFVLVSCGVLIGGAYAGPKIIGVAKPDRETAGKYERVSEDEARSSLFITRQGQAVHARSSMNLEVGDQVETGPVWALIRYPAGHEVYLQPRTRVRLGSIFAYFGELFVRARGQFSVETEFITLGVQGTEFWVKVDESQNSAFGVLEGSVVMSSKRGSWNPISVARNDVMTIHRDQRPRAQKESEKEVARVRRTIAQVDEALRAQPLPPPSVCPGGPDCPPCPATQPDCPGGTQPSLPTRPGSYTYPPR
jgi:hypothetical protein